MVGLGKQDPGEVVNESEVLDWERPATRDHDGLTVRTWTFLHAEYGPCVGPDSLSLVGRPHPTSTWKRSRLRLLGHIDGQGSFLELAEVSASANEKVTLKRTLTRKRVDGVLRHDTEKLNEVMCGVVSKRENLLIVTSQSAES
jgi:hypothetical protein